MLAAAAVGAAGNDAVAAAAAAVAAEAAAGGGGAPVAANLDQLVDVTVVLTTMVDPSSAAVEFEFEANEGSSAAEAATRPGEPRPGDALF